MKILRVIPSLNPEAGGAVEGARQMDRQLLSMGILVEVVSLDSKSESEFLCSYPAKVHPLGPSVLNYSYNKRLVPWLTKNHSRFDAIVVDGIWQYHSFGVWRAISNSETPYYVYTHGMLDPWFKKTYPLKHIKKSLYWPWAEYRVLRDAKAVLFTTEEEMILARKSFSLYKCNEQIVSYGISEPPKDVSLASRFFLKYSELKGKKIILFLGRINEKKGCDQLIEAFGKLAVEIPDLHLVMAGPDEKNWKSSLVKMAKNLKVDGQITWTGMLTGDDKWGAFYAADVFCLPSHQENFGVVVAEALSCSKPVLITNKVNIWREIVKYGAGIVVDDDLESIYKQIEDWLDLTSAEFTSMKGSALKCFEDNFRIESTSKKMISLITTQLNSTQT